MSYGPGYGPAIACDGERPGWLGDDEIIITQAVEGSERPAKSVVWPWVGSLRLPAEHPYYRATDAGFKYWPGFTHAAPDDWDGGWVMFQDGFRIKGAKWDKLCEANVIIGYHPKPEAVVTWVDATATFAKEMWDHPKPEAPALDPAKECFGFISRADHYRRVNELLAANNALLERARVAERAGGFGPNSIRAAHARQAATIAKYQRMAREILEDE